MERNQTKARFVSAETQELGVAQWSMKGTCGSDLMRLGRQRNEIKVLGLW